MLTKQEQEILDNAPADAISYGVFSDKVYYGGLCILSLADLRKKQEQLRYACCAACNHEWKEPLGVDVNSVACPECGDRVEKPEPVKPRMKVEYVKVCAEEAVYYFNETDDEIYLAPNDDCNPISLQDYINELAIGEDSIYRKVETEITWQDKVKSMFGNRDDAFSFNECDIRINVLAHEDTFTDVKPPSFINA